MRSCRTNLLGSAPNEALMSKAVRPKFEKAYKKHAPSELALEEATEMKDSLCSQLIHIVRYNETHKAQVVQEFIQDTNLEQSFGEDAPREDLPV